MHSTRFKYMIDTSLDAYFMMDMEGRLREVNGTAADMYGYSRDELLSMTIHDIEVKESSQEIRAHMGQVMKKGHDRFETCHRHKDGTLLQVEVSASYVPEEGLFLSFYRDITPRKRIEEQLRISEENYRTFASLTSHYVHKCRRLGAEPYRVLWMGGEVGSISGYTSEEVFEKGCWISFVHPDDREMVQAYLMNLAPGNDGEVIFRLIDRQGRTRWVLEKNRCLAGNQEGELILYGATTDITEQREAEEGRREIEGLFRLFMRYTPVYTFIKRIEGERSRVVMVSDNFVDMAGIPAESMIGMTMEELFSADFAAKINADDLAVVRDKKVVQLQENLGARHFTTIKFPIEREAADPLLAGFTIDVTEHRKAEDAIRQQARLLDVVRDSIMVRDMGGRISYWNEGSVRQYGISREEAVGRISHELLGTVFPLPLDDILRELVDTGIWEGELEHRTGQGERITVFSRWVLQRTPDGLPAEVLEINSDITGRKQAEKERDNLQQQLFHAQKMESLGVLAGGIAHDFNNILTSILGNAELALCRIDQASPAADNLRRIESSSLRAAELARQMLAYAGRGRFLVQSLDLNGLVEEMAMILESSVSKKVTLHLSLGRGLPAIVGDATQIRQIVMNLVINAAEAYGEHPGEVLVTTDCSSYDRHALDGFWLSEPLPPKRYVSLVVRDTGCGMDEDTRSRVFDPFFTTKFIGRGLGMAAVLGIVRGHSGAIRVESEPSCGTTFTVLFPVGEGGVVAEEPEAWAPGKPPGGTVLLVDDEEAVLEFGVQILELLGHSVLTARNGKEAYDLYRLRHREVDFVILDLSMPVMDGEQTLKLLKEVDPQVKVVISSGYSGTEVADRFAGRAAAILEKPFSIDSLRRVIGQI